MFYKKFLKKLKSEQESHLQLKTELLSLFRTTSLKETHQFNNKLLKKLPKKQFKEMLSCVESRFL